ncbi:MAG TPA: tetratricopeptide repeat protein [Candidatus Acidoferrales bacterium]|nr:tetratricopeptide repeat protein [Candidatus Acidoferrales bacterium]
MLVLLPSTRPANAQVTSTGAGSAQNVREYVGAKACSQCHETASRLWSESWHGKMLQPPTPRSVEANFAPGKMTLHGSTFLLQHHDGHYYLTESYLAGKPWEHEIDYTLGGRRVQQYLSTLRDGRILVLPISWDNAHKKWIDNLDVDNPESAGDPAPIWNKSCMSCHVTDGQKNFDLQQDAYHSTWKDSAVGCESCHGPGSEHVARASMARARKSPASSNATERTVIDSSIVNLAKLDPTRSTMACAQCHSLRDVYADGFRPGGNYYDYFLPVLEYRLPASKNPAFWPDGRPRWLANEATAFWQSECFLQGHATCLTCHTRSHDVDVAHNPQLASPNNALCTQCHTAIAKNVGAHTHHALHSRGNSCIECHMPRTVTSIHARMRDHSISIPVPENTIRHGIPNACNMCHTDKTPDWAAAKVAAWYGANSGQKFIRRADAFSDARSGNAAAVPGLLQIVSDSSAGPFIRSNAVGYLSEFPEDPSAYAAVVRSMNDAQPLVRATAAFSIRPRAAQRAAIAPQLAALLADPVTIVKVSAAIGLVSMGVQHIPGEDGVRFEQAKQLYRVRAELDSDDAQQQFAAGKFFLFAGEPTDAINDLRAASKLDPGLPVQIYLAQALAAKGDFASAEGTLKKIRSDDPQYDAAQRLLAQIEVKSTNANGNATEAQTPATNPAAQSDSTARNSFLDGQLMYQNKNYVNALPQLEQALRLAPHAAWATQAQIYRAICMEKLGRMAEAESAMRALDSNEAASHDIDLQLAFAELLYRTGRPDEALKRVDNLIAVVPESSLAYFWQAKLLLQLHRVADAARAAEKSMRLAPDAPAAHNLLIGIYQMQGRTKEAAEQAAWLRDYERRIESH